MKDHLNNIGNDETMEQLLDYWKARLADAPILELPTDRPRPAVQSFRGESQHFSLSPDLAEGLKVLSLSEGVTLFVTLVAAFQVLLHRYSGQDDIVIGTPTAGQSSLELEGLIGIFGNTLALRTDLSGTPSFRQVLSRVHEVYLGAYAHQDMPFEKLVTELQVQRDMSRHPLFQVMLILQPTALQEMQLPGLTIRGLTETNETSKFDLALSLVEHADGLTGTIEYSTDLFNAETITRLASHFQTLLEAMVEHPETAIAELPLLTVPERNQLLIEWNATTADYPKDKCIHQLFEEQVAKTPDAIAVVFGNQLLTYKKLNERANKLAHYLRKLDVGPEILVGLWIERSLEMLVGVLGILKAGGAYVPLNPAYPKERLEFFLTDIAAPVLLTQQSLLALLPAHSAQIVCLDRDWDTIDQESPNNPFCSSIAENLAYVIYTSGSTGIPKGVSIVHSNTVALISWAKSVFEIEEISGMLASTTYCFDLSVFEFFLPLTQGGQLILVENLLQLSASQGIEGITLINTVPSAITELLRMNKIPESVQTICLAGEPLKTELVNRLYQQTKVKKIIDLYGPTEDTTYSTVSLRKPQKRASIGRPIANTQIYILDNYLQPVPIGISGEIHIGGDGLARGYLNRPELTAEKFIKNHFSDDPKARLYKTGDLARYLPDGTIEYLGRIDHQVKIRGFRIELGEIESALGQHPHLREVVVGVYESIPGDKRLVAYLVPQGASAPTPSELRDFLKPKLPEYMVPSAFVFLEDLPLTPNGKLDRKALPEPDQSHNELEADFVAPRSPVEKLLAEIWSNVLRIDRVGIHDNFFELGGHSLLAVKVIVEVNKLFNTDLPLGAFYQAPTVEELGIIISSGNQQPSWYSLVPIQTQGSRPPLFAIHTITFQDLPRHLGKDQPLYFLRYGMAAEISNRSVRLPLLEELASHYIKEMQQVQPLGPYYLMGFSFGGMIAYEMASQLLANGHQVNFVGLLDTYLTSEKQLRPINKIISNLSGQSPSRLLELAKSKITDRVKPDKSGSDFWPHMYTSAPDIACGTGYQPKSYNGRVTLFQGWEQESKFFVHTPPEQAWKKLLGDSLEVQQITGTHYNIFDEPHVKVLAAKIIACMDKAINGG